jgi:hypothetical protein
MMVHCGPIMPRSRMPRWASPGVQRIPVQRPAIPRARRHRSPSRHGRGSMIRRPVIWRPQPRSAPTATPPAGLGRRLTRHWPEVRGHARPAARRSSPERTAPAIASSRNVRTGKARRPGLPGQLGTPRRPRARTDHTSHSSPATCRSVAGSRFPQLHHIDCSPRQSASRLGRSCGHQAPPPGPGLVCGAGRYHRTGRHSAPATDSASSRAGRTTRVASACPPTSTERPAPGQIQAGSRCAARDQGSLETLPGAPRRPE